MKIAVDFDNVLADTMTSWIDYYNKQYNKYLNKKDITIWEFWKLEKIALEREESFKIFHLVWHNWQILPSIEPNIGKVVDKLRSFAKVDIVTATQGKIINWLTYHKINYNELIKITDSKKAELDYDIFIDDSPSDALEIGKLKKICLLYDQPWNQPDQKSLFSNYNTIYRINCLDEALYYIHKFIDNNNRV